MKVKISKLLLAIALMALIVSCKKEDSVPDDISPSDVAETLVSGEWVITYFFDSDQEETSHFNGYVFQFAESGTLTATKGMTTVTGTWSSGTDDSQAKIYISFSTPEDFEELSDDWHVLERTNSKIRLEDVSGGNGGTDLLTFEKD